jgi:8-oxo-dGTP pyrophosphatase MutT (NUDIX family)
VPGWITAKEALRRDPEFFRRRGDASWSWNEITSTLGSKWGAHEVRVAVHPDGTPDFDRVIYSEAPGMCAVLYGRDRDGGYHIGIIEEARPFADNLDGTPADPPLRFGQPAVMGVLDRIIGSGGASALESAEDGAVREAMEEAGITGVLGVRRLGYQNPNAAICATWDHLLEIEVDLDQVGTTTGREARIHQAHYLPVREVLHRIALGDHDGVNYRAAVPGNAFLVWLANHTEALL